jgi:hypothetical protein
VIPIRIVETERPDFEGPVVELWRDDEFIGQIFWDGEVPIVQIYPAGEGDVHDLDVNDLMRALETGLSMVDPSAFDDGLDEELAGLRMASALSLGGAEDGGWEDEQPATLALVGEFDPKAAHRSDDGEGFFPAAVAEDFIRRCEELDLAVVEMEGFDLERGNPRSRPGLELVVRPQEVMAWRDFRSYANARALDTLGAWPTRESLVVAFVVQQPDGETFVA